MTQIFSGNIITESVNWQTPEPTYNAEGVAKPQKARYIASPTTAKQIVFPQQGLKLEREDVVLLKHIKNWNQPFALGQLNEDDQEAFDDLSSEEKEDIYLKNWETLINTHQVTLGLLVNASPVEVPTEDSKNYSILTILPVEEILEDTTMDSETKKKILGQARLAQNCAVIFKRNEQWHVLLSKETWDSTQPEQNTFSSEASEKVYRDLQERGIVKSGKIAIGIAKFIPGISHAVFNARLNKEIYVKATEILTGFQIHELSPAKVIPLESHQYGPNVTDVMRADPRKIFEGVSIPRPKREQEEVDLSFDSSQQRSRLGSSATTTYLSGWTEGETSKTMAESWSSEEKQVALVASGETGTVPANQNQTSSVPVAYSEPSSHFESSEIPTSKPTPKVIVDAQSSQTNVHTPIDSGETREKPVAHNPATNVPYKKQEGSSTKGEEKEKKNGKCAVM